MFLILIWSPSRVNKVSNYLFTAEEVSEHLAGVKGLVEILLKHATNDKLSNDVKQNSAICLAKLATADRRYSNDLVIGAWGGGGDLG